jgi:hypothetical protein
MPQALLKLSSLDSIEACEELAGPWSIRQDEAAYSGKMFQSAKPMRTSSFLKRGSRRSGSNLRPGTLI